MAPSPRLTRGPEPKESVSIPEKDRRSRPWVRIAVLALAGLAAVTAGGVALGRDLTREPTEKEIETAGQKEIASRWRALDAGEIFPPRADTRAYSPTHSFPVPTWTALRVGIAPKVSCAAGFDRPVADVLVKYGCRTVLRATYVDGSRTLVTTLGVAVMPDAERAVRVETDLNSSAKRTQRHGVRAVPFPGTIASGFTDSLRQDFASDANGTPYLFFSSSGWITDRATRVDTTADNTFAFAKTALDQVILRFADTTEPCRRRGVRC